MMEAILLLATLCQQHKFTLAPGQTLQLSPSITLRPQGGLQMTVKSRREARSGV